MGLGLVSYTTAKAEQILGNGVAWLNHPIIHGAKMKMTEDEFLVAYPCLDFDNFHILSFNQSLVGFDKSDLGHYADEEIKNIYSRCGMFDPNVCIAPVIIPNQFSYALNNNLQRIGNSNLFVGEKGGNVRLCIPIQESNVCICIEKFKQ